MSRQAVITPEGLEKLKEEIEHLSTAKRREVAARIKEAREFGDISENAEYDDAKNEQALLEGRIAQLEERLRRATVIDEKALGTDEVGFGSIVHVKDQKTGDSQKFQIVGSTEANPLEHKLSNESPIGKALVGRKRNDVVTVEVPRGPEEETQNHQDRDRLRGCQSGDPGASRLARLSSRIDYARIGARRPPPRPARSRVSSKT